MNIRRKDYASCLTQLMPLKKKGKPFSDFEYICELQIKNGLDLGENYLNDHAC